MSTCQKDGIENENAKNFTGLAVAPKTDSTNVDEGRKCTSKKIDTASDRMHVGSLPVNSIQIPALPVSDVRTHLKNEKGTEFITCVQCNEDKNSKYANESDVDSLTRAVDAIDFLDTIELVNELNSDEDSIGVDIDALEEYLE